MRVLVFGDSITQGYHDPGGGYVQLLNAPYIQSLIDNPSDDVPYLFNLGISSNTSANLLKRFKSDTENRQQQSETLAFVFMIGTNDAVIENGKPWSSPQEYKHNITKIFKSALEYSSKVLAVELPPSDDSKVAWGNYIYKNEDIKKLNSVLHEVCRELNIPCAEIFDSFEKAMLSDGLHPNTDGHKLIADLVRPELEKLLA